MSADEKNHKTFSTEKLFGWKDRRSSRDYPATRKRLSLCLYHCYIMDILSEPNLLYILFVVMYWLTGIVYDKFHVRNVKLLYIFNEMENNVLLFESS